MTGTCNPAEVNYAHFMEVLSDTSPFRELDAGHMQFLDAGPVRMAFYDLLCGFGHDSDASVLRHAVRGALQMIQNGTLPTSDPSTPILLHQAGALGATSSSY